MTQSINTHFKKETKIILFVVFLPVAIGLLVIFVYPYFLTGNNRQAIVAFSRDNEYSVKLITDSGLLILQVMHGNKSLNSINTSASVFQKFAVGWDPKENILVMHSSDIGTKAWSVKENNINEINAKQYYKLAKELYQKKYDTST